MAPSVPPLFGGFFRQTRIDVQLEIRGFGIAMALSRSTGAILTSGTVRYLPSRRADAQGGAAAIDGGQDACISFDLREPGEIAAMVFHPRAEALPKSERFFVRH